MDRLRRVQAGLALVFGAIVLLLVAGVPVPAGLLVGVISASFAVFVVRAHKRKTRVKALWWLLPTALAFGLLASSVSYADAPCSYVLAPQWYCWWPFFDFGSFVFSAWSCMIIFVYVPYPPGCSSGGGYLAIPEVPGL